MCRDPVASIMVVILFIVDPRSPPMLPKPESMSLRRRFCSVTSLLMSRVRDLRAATWSERAPIRSLFLGVGVVGWGLWGGGWGGEGGGVRVVVVEGIACPYVLHVLIDMYL